VLQKGLYLYKVNSMVELFLDSRHVLDEFVIQVLCLTLRVILQGLRFSSLFKNQQS
jgi:hypothetical protein